jgi:hypothetical protein
MLKQAPRTPDATPCTKMPPNPKKTHSDSKKKRKKNHDTAYYPSDE